jgi:integrase
MTLTDLGRRLARVDDVKTRWNLVWEFLEEYRWEPDGVQLSLLRDEPAATGDERWDVLLAALAEHLAAQHDQAAPEWTEMRVPPHVAVWRSVRVHGETKTEQSRRTFGLPVVAVQALRTWADSQAGERLAAGEGWQDTGLVFTNHRGAALDAGNVRKMFKRVCTEAGAGDGWTPRELRTTFVSLMSHQGASIEEIARLVGHASTRTTEIVYRRELRPVITTGAEIMDELFIGN